ncbi:hypothetical protein FLAG1_07943 [Fusarium langsethiae]|uniref:Uncharacterized protein n=1 Tax=Fusarium langsethiae TaxID=179993 RepID=A0A0N0DD56_FUSLA|nr:hypothetical protein FLAG1_07943 [Fusarium langsethiae]GKU07675.1 unnamed protein product [Fusarium langsethiae]GKU21864.1 unnamed protein product [Fusarium langsethiae]
MLVRRSTRLKVKADEPTPSQKPTQEAKKTRKRKAPASSNDRPVKKAPKIKSPTKRRDDKSTHQRSKLNTQDEANKDGKSSEQMPANTSNGPFSSFPPEVMNLVEDIQSLGNLSKTSKAFHGFVMPQLYKRVKGFVSYHAHIAKLIRTIEPLLTIEQRRQLKKEGQYKGQQESFPDDANEKKKPEVADFVRQTIFEIGDPGEKHRFIVYRYIEELLKTVDNLEVFAATDLTEPMAKVLATKKRIQALWLHVSSARESDAEAVTTIKGLKHLKLEMSNWYLYKTAPLALIWNSRSTLRSLDLDKSLFYSLYENWVDKSSQATESSNRHADLSALKSLSLRRATIDSDDLDAFTRAIDFTALEDLYLGTRNIRIELLYQRLVETFSATTSADIKLRSLSVHLGSQTMSNLTRMTAKPNEEEPGIDFISSFDTLTSLTVVDAGIHSSDLPDPGLKDTLLRGIFMHKNLTRLEFRDTISLDGWKAPRLDTQMVKRFIENFPQLKHFHFHPKQKELNKIAEALSWGRNLESIGMNLGREINDKEEGHEFLCQLILQILDRDSDDNTRDYRWEDHSKFSRFSAGLSIWEVGSKLGKAKKGIKKAETIVSISNSKRTVMYRDISQKLYLRLTRGSMIRMEEWVNKVSKDLD